MIFRMLLLLMTSTNILSIFQNSSTSYKPSTDNANNGFGFASVFHENMVLQMKPFQAVLWGYGTPGAIVNISLVQDVHSTKVFNGPDGRGVWKIVLKPQSSGGPHTFQGVHDDHGLLSWILLKNVMFGEVWICTGQSNMQFTVSMASNATEEVKRASNYPNIRLMTLAPLKSDIPLYDLKSVQQQWSVASSETVGGPPWTYFSAICWFFAQHLYDQLNVPIGVISSFYGATMINSWMPPSALQKCQIENNHKYNSRAISTSAANSVLWNALVHPFLNMTIKGAIWYQDKQNYSSDFTYSCSFPAMIQGWREAWYEGTQMLTDPMFPFGFVQFSSANVSEDGTYPVMRWHQTADYGSVPNVKMPNTFMAVATDLGDPQSPYGSELPRDKQDVAARLVKGALNLAYSQDVEYQGPVPEGSATENGSEVVIAFISNSKLKVLHEENFEICCNFSDCNYEKPFNTSNWNVASILSHTHKSVTVDSRICSESNGKAALLRYAWRTYACRFKRCAIYDSEGLPAPPFVVLVH